MSLRPPTWGINNFCLIWGSLRLPLQQDVYKFEKRHRLSQICIIYKEKCHGSPSVLAGMTRSLWSFDSVSTWRYSPEGRPYSQTICGCSKCNHPRLCISIAVFPSPPRSHSSPCAGVSRLHALGAQKPAVTFLPARAPLPIQIQRNK